MSDLNEFAGRYIAIWNEHDPALRRKWIDELFAPDLAHYTPTMEVHGHAEMADRVTLSYERWVKPGEYVFRAVPNANGHHGTVRFNWEMVHLPTDTAISVGFDFIVLDEKGLIKTDHQFVDS